MPRPRHRDIDDVLGLSGAFIQTLYSSVIGIPLAMAVAFGSCGGHCYQSIQHLRGRRPDEVTTWRRAATSLGEGLFAVPLAGLTHWLVDTFAGVCVGSVLGTPLTKSEQRFARSIFGRRIRLRSARVVETGWKGRGMCSAGTIFIDRRDLDHPESRAIFAHELTHQYQDSRWLRPDRGTLRATWEAYQYWLKVRNVYHLDITSSIPWRKLEPESQAVIVEAWVEYRTWQTITDEEWRERLAFYLDWRGIQVNEPDHIARLLAWIDEAQLFRGIDGNQTPQTWDADGRLVS